MVKLIKTSLKALTKPEHNPQKQWLWAIALWFAGLFSCLLLATVVKFALRLVS